MYYDTLQITLLFQVGLMLVGGIVLATVVGIALSR